MAIFEVAIERKIDIKRGILAQICTWKIKYREYTTPPPRASDPTPNSNCH